MPPQPEPRLDGELPIYELSPERIRRRTPEEIEELRKKQGRERAERYLWVYGLLGLQVVAHKDGTLVVSGTFGGRKLAPGEPRAAEPPPPYEDATVLSSSSDSQRYMHASACFSEYKTQL